GRIERKASTRCAPCLSPEASPATSIRLTRSRFEFTSLVVPVSRFFRVGGDTVRAELIEVSQHLCGVKITVVRRLLHQCDTSGRVLLSSFTFQKHRAQIVLCFCAALPGGF